MPNKRSLNTDRNILTDSGMARQVVEFDLWFDPTPPKTDINYMRDVRRNEWKIADLKPPVYLYQPDVEPTPEGGKVKVEPREYKKKKSQFVYPDRILNPEEQPWRMLAADGKEYVGNSDTLNNRAFLYETEGGSWTMQLMDKSYRFVEERRQQADLETAIQQLDSKMKATEARKKVLHVDAKLAESTAQKEKERKLKQERVQQKIDAGSGDEGDEAGDRGSDDSQGDVEIDAQSDEEVAISDNLDDLFDDLSDDPNGLIDSDEEEENVEKKENDERPVRPLTTEPVNKVELNGMIVERVLGPQTIKEEDLVSFMMEVVLCEKPVLIKKFRDKLVTAEQKEAFKVLVKEKLCAEKNNGVIFFKLKKKGK